LFFGHRELLCADVRAQQKIKSIGLIPADFDRMAKRKEGLSLRTALPLSGLGPVAQTIVCLTRVSPAVD